MTNEEFKQKFKLKDDDEVTLWSETEAIGFTISRRYPNNSKFIPAKTKNGEDDSIVAIWAGYYPSKIKNNRADLYFRVGKASRYLFKNHWDYNFSDESSPTQDSLELSKKSSQPIELEERGFEYDILSGKFLDKEKGSEIQPGEIIDNLYNLHVQTTGTSFRGVILRAKHGSAEKTFGVLTGIIKFLINSNRQLLDKEIKKDKGHLYGFDGPYRHADLITLGTEKFSIPGTDLKLTKNAFILTSFIIFISFTVSYFYEELRAIKFLSDNSGNIFFDGSFAVVVYFLIDIVIPHIVLSITNLLIRLRWKLMNIKFRI